MDVPCWTSLHKFLTSVDLMNYWTPAAMLHSPNLSPGHANLISASGRNLSLDGLRGVAVILTFLVHYCGSYMAIFRSGNPNTVQFWGWSHALDRVLYWLFHSHHGVYIFFILSGFLICRLSLKENFRYSVFVRKRAKRVYPAFLLALALCLALGPWLKIPSPSLTVFIQNLFFLNGIPSLGVAGIIFNNVTWSLFYEMVFYIIFPPVILASRYFVAPVIPSIILFGVVVAYLPAVFGFYSEFFLFLFAGAVVGALNRVQIRDVADIFSGKLLACLYMFATTMFTLGFITTSQFVFLFSACISIILCKLIDGRSVLARALAWWPLAELGRISYSFYLLHSVAISIVFAFWWRIYIPAGGSIFNGVFIGMLAFMGSVVLAWASYQLSERFYFRDHAAVDVRGEQQTRTS